MSKHVYTFNIYNLFVNYTTMKPSFKLKITLEDPTVKFSGALTHSLKKLH